MTYERFEDLPVWKAALELAEQAYALTAAAEAQLRSKASLKSQLERAALSVSNNVAEGFERGTTQELITFLYIARGSAGEVRSMLCLMERLDSFQDFKSQISNLKSQAEGCAKQLRAWADHLQNSEIKGQRHLTERSRTEEMAKKEAQEREEDRKRFMEEVRAIARGEKG